MFASRLPESIIKGLSIRARELGAVNLGQGIPSFPTAPHIIKAAKHALDDPTIGVYPNFLGELELRQAIAQKLKLSEANILITVGAMEATATSILSLIQNDETVGIVTPDYCNHLPQALLARARVTEIPLYCHSDPPLAEKNLSRMRDSTWQLDLPLIEQAAKSGLKLLIITNPSNPTGAVITKPQLDQLVQLAQKYAFWILSDETYNFLTYDQPFISLLDYKDQHDKLLIVRSFSKEYAMTGWRVGFLVANPDFIKQAAKVHDALVGCVPKISQRAALAALTGPQEIVREYIETLSRRRNLAIDLISQIPQLSLISPQGAYYAFPSFILRAIEHKANESRSSHLTSVELCERLLTEAKVAVIPGAAFGLAGEGHFRVSFAVEDEVLKEGLNRVKIFFEKYDQSTRNP